MQVKEIIMSAAMMAGREDICGYLAGDEEDEGTAAKDTENMVRCFNLVENEIALEYKPLKYSQRIVTDNGIVEFAELQKQALDIIKVEDESGNKVKYKLYQTYLKTKPDTVVVHYTYIPQKKTLEDKSDFAAADIPLRTAALGVVTEFSLISSLFDEAVMWDRRYKDSLQRACSKKVKSVLPARRWI